MVFSSTIFLFIFLPLVLIGYFLVRIEYKNVFLLAASLFFYAWGEPKFVWLMIASIILNYIFSLVMVKYANHKYTAKVILIIAISVNLAVLVFYKYWGFIVENLNKLMNTFGLESMEVTYTDLPIGISFFTFQIIAYIIDLYRKDISHQSNPINLGLYISFFPQLIAGPIIRYKNISDQLKSRTVSLEDFHQGIIRFTIGLGKKVLIANPLGHTADKVFSLSGGDLTSEFAWFGIICYSFQLYYDFSGYSDMAIGLARMFGFHFPENFNYPYISRSIQEFWRRWHISLSSWFRDYVYIPLGGNRTSVVKTYRNLAIVFLITGIWHGASWNFVVWGLWHGAFLMAERAFLGNLINRLWLPIRLLYALIVIVIGWVFFRSETMSEATHILASMFTPWQQDTSIYGLTYFLDTQIAILLVIAGIGVTPIPKLIVKRFASFLETRSLQVGYEWATTLYIIFILFMTIMTLATSTYNPFIYFRF